MRNLICIILSLLCTVFALEQGVTNPSRNLERLVNLQKLAAEAVLNGLSIFEERTKQNLELNLNQLKTEALVDIHKIINTALENVNVSIDKGKQDGKKIDDCYSYARNNLETKNTNANAGLQTCIKNGYTALEGPLANVASSIEAVKKLLSNLDAIIPNCYSTSFIKMQACVMTNLILTRGSLNQISINAKQVTVTTGVMYAKMIIDVRKCITMNAADTRTFSTDIVIKTDICVRNAPKDVPSTTSKPSTSTSKSTITNKPSTTARSTSTRKP